MAFKPRVYQQEAIDACVEYLNNNDGNPILCLPTGSGKSIIVAELLKELLKYEGTRGLCVTHVKELITQNHSKMPIQLGAGIYSASVGKRNVHNRAIFCGIQSVYKKANLFSPVNLIIIDECQLLSPNQDTMYGRFIRELKALNPNLRVVGLSATPYRTGDGMLTETTLFDEIVYDLPMEYLIDEGYLAKLKGKRGATQADMSECGTVAGEWNLGHMAGAFDQDHITKAAVGEILQYGKTRNKGLIFCSSVAHCHHVAAYIKAAGETCAVITGELDKEEREEILRAYTHGVYKYIINYSVLTTGFDEPEIDLIALLRGTKSTGLYVQMLGRGMRPVYAKGFDLSTKDGRLAAIAAGLKPSGCLVLDYGQNVETHGAVDKIRIEKKYDKESGELKDTISVQPTKMCDGCGEDNHVQARICPKCGYEYPTEAKHDREASNAAILSADIEPEWHNVDNVLYDRHKKAGGFDSLKVTYVTGFGVKREWVSLENPKAKRFAGAWWKKRGEGHTPLSVDEALKRKDEIKTPSRIATKPDGKFERICDYDDSERDDEAETVEAVSVVIEEDEIPW